ncbi:MAG: Acetyltransferase [Firmicutes bacterium]|nr:Acetyltransferase [Bacillota bacterium]
MAKVIFCVGKKELLDVIEPLWLQLIEHHQKVACNFPHAHDKPMYAVRKTELLEVANGGNIRVELARDEEVGEYVGYCVTTLDKEKIGEIQSLFVKQEYRKQGVGDTFMRNAVAWLKENGANSKRLVVGEGNEGVLDFYRRYNFLPRRLVLESVE